MLLLLWLLVVATWPGAVAAQGRHRRKKALRRGNVLAREGDLDGALLAYTQAIDIDPQCADAYRGRGNAYVGKRAYDEAIADYTEAIRLTYYKRAVAYGKKGDFKQAAADFSEVIRLNPADAMPYCNRGVVYYDMGDYDSALADFLKYIRLSPGPSEACHYRDLAYYKKGEYDKAIAGFSEAIRLNPKYFSGILGPRRRLCGEAGIRQSHCGLY